MGFFFLSRLPVSFNTIKVSHQSFVADVFICSISLCPHQVHQFSNKQTEMALRVASLDYLGTVAARLRKDAVTSKMDQRSIDRILQQVAGQVPL